MKTLLQILVPVIFCVSAAAQVPTPPNNYVSMPKALYVWNATTANHVNSSANQCIANWEALLTNDKGKTDSTGSADTMLAFAKSHAADNIKLFVGSIEYNDPLYKTGYLPDEDGLAHIVAQAAKDGMTVDAVWYPYDDPNKIGDPTQNTDIIKAVQGYNSRHPNAKITMMQCDSEPSDPSKFPVYVEMLQKLYAGAQAAGLKSSATIKPLYLTAQYNGAPLIKTIVANTTRPMLMDYTNDPATALSRAQTALKYTTVANPIDIAVETGYKGMNNNTATFSCMVRGHPTDFFNDIVTLHNGLKSSPGFGEIVIHDYTQFYNDLDKAHQDPYIPTNGYCHNATPAVNGICS